jgi:hypothetical protein
MGQLPPISEKVKKEIEKDENEFRRSQENQGPA